MPWKETCLMDEKLRFIAACSGDDINLSEVARQFGISRKTAYKWLERYDALGLDGLKARPPAPLVAPGRLALPLESAIVALRKAHPRYGPKKLRVLLAQTRPGLALPAPSTIGEVLQRNGLIVPRRRRVRTPPGQSPLLPAQQPNDLWCIDFKGNFVLGDRSTCYPLTLTDNVSRYLLKCEGMAQPRFEPVQRHLELAFREYGLPSRIRSDNGPPFASVAPGGLSALSVWWIKLGIRPERIKPGHPEQNGQHERMHRTLKAEVAVKATPEEQQLELDRFRHEYNDERPHEALGQVTPAKKYEPSRRRWPEQLKSPEYEDSEVRWTHDGVISWKGQSVKVGASMLDKEPVGLKQVSEHEWDVSYGPICLGRLDHRDRELKLTEVPKKTATKKDCEPVVPEREANLSEHVNQAPGQRAMESGQ
jgi:transposase InsO family protein